MSTGNAHLGERPNRPAKGSSELQFKPSRESLSLADEIAKSSKLRVDIPVRQLFVRDPEGKGSTPLSRLVATRGRGNAVAIKLYLALIWRCAAPPFDTQVSSRKWAALLSLDDPERAGAKRVADAFRTLEREQLISLSTRPGEASTIQLLEESGIGAAYELPSTAYVLADDPKVKDRHRYFKVPARLWTQGHIQSLSAPALAVLLAVLSSQEAPGKPVWWSTTLFPARFGLSPATRARGTRELVDNGLLKVGKMLVNDSNFSSREFAPERVRNVYRLAGAAGPVRTIKKKPDRRGTGPAPAKASRTP
ncbi:MAG: hypothetical protein EON54_05875 [Alcaligenaceae bacterium]|nr:MAG: hypothetical protein EON54_05875 [Alcaligenaceae bacterium]